MKKLIFITLLAVLSLIALPNKLMAQDQDHKADSLYSFESLSSSPTYPDGLDTLYAFLAKHIKYPKQAAEKFTQGKVYVSYVIEKDGSLSNFKILQSLGNGTDEEAIRVLKLTKRWNPGLVDGKPVRVRYNMVIIFRPGGQNY